MLNPSSSSEVFGACFLLLYGTTGFQRSEEKIMSDGACMLDNVCKGVVGSIAGEENNNSMDRETWGLSTTQAEASLTSLGIVVELEIVDSRAGCIAGARAKVGKSQL